jgi:uncharacterized membrane protein
MFPRHRFDALTDGIFGVAMTLLVLDIRIPDGFEAHSNRELTDALFALWPKIWPYGLSFIVLGGRWRELTHGRPGHGEVSERYVRWGLLYLLLVTLVPFSTIVLGRFASLAPSIWLYAGNLVGLALVGWRWSAARPEEDRQEQADNLVGLVVFLVSSALAVAISFRSTPFASTGFLLNFFAPMAERIMRQRRAAHPSV